MYHPDDICQGAQEIRRYLKDPLQVADADELDQKLEALLAPGIHSQQVADTILDLLNQYGETAEWIENFLESSNRQRNLYGDNRLAGDPTFAPLVYVCPHGGCRWVIIGAGDQPDRCMKNQQAMGTTQKPWCPAHNEPLQAYS